MVKRLHLAIDGAILGTSGYTLDDIKKILADLNPEAKQLLNTKYKFEELGWMNRDGGNALELAITTKKVSYPRVNKNSDAIQAEIIKALLDEGMIASFDKIIDSHNPEAIIFWLSKYSSIDLPTIKKAIATLDRMDADNGTSYHRLTKSCEEFIKKSDNEEYKSKIINYFIEVTKCARDIKSEYINHYKVSEYKLLKINPKNHGEKFFEWKLCKNLFTQQDLPLPTEIMCYIGEYAMGFIGDSTQIS